MVEYTTSCSPSDRRRTLIYIFFHFSGAGKNKIDTFLRIILDRSLDMLYPYEIPPVYAVAWICETADLRGVIMNCNRSAILMLMACISLGASTRGSQSPESKADPIHAVIAGHTGTPMAWSHSPRLSRLATISRFTPWRNRLKIILHEADPKLFERCDVGFALLPSRLITSAAVEPVSCALSTRARLRC